MALPVLVGVAILGDRPTWLSWLGIAIAVPALWLVSQTRAFAQAGPEAGIWPVVIGRVTAALVILPTARERIPVRLGIGVAATGGTAALALVCYLLATRRELLVIAVVLSSL